MNFYKKYIYSIQWHPLQNDPRFLWGLVFWIIGISILSRRILGTGIPIDIMIGLILLYYGGNMIFRSKSKKQYD